MKATNLDLRHLVPTVAADGNAVFISEQGIPTLVFFEGRKHEGDSLQADVVASVRFTNIEDLKNFQKAIGDTIAQHQSREK